MIRVTYKPVRALVPHVPIQENNYFIFFDYCQKNLVETFKISFFSSFASEAVKFKSW